MPHLNIVRQRLQNQRLCGVPFEQPEDVVRWLGAVQAQEYHSAKWAIAQRTASATDAMLDRALATGALLRTHVLRPTWHVVAPDDILWLLALTAPHVHATNAYYYQKTELNEEIFKRSHAVLINTLQGGQALTRAELGAALARAGIDTNDPLRLGLIMMHAELEAVICSGPLRGKQYTYVLLDDRVPPSKTLDRDAALAELARRYFASHGPATLKDFCWWSGLTTAEAKVGVELAKPTLMQETIGQQTYWFATPSVSAETAPQTIHLLPNYDEYVVAYVDRSALLDTPLPKSENPRDNIVFNPTVIQDGKIIGTWKRSVTKRQVLIEAKLMVPPNPTHEPALAAAAERLGQFLQIPAALRLEYGAFPG